MEDTPFGAGAVKDSWPYLGAAVTSMCLDCTGGGNAEGDRTGNDRMAGAAGAGTQPDGCVPDAGRSTPENGQVWSGAADAGGTPRQRTLEQAWGQRISLLGVSMPSLPPAHSWVMASAMPGAAPMRATPVAVSYTHLTLPTIA